MVVEYVYAQLLIFQYDMIFLDELVAMEQLYSFVLIILLHELVELVLLLGQIHLVRVTIFQVLEVVVERMVLVQRTLYL